MVDVSSDTEILEPPPPPYKPSSENLPNKTENSSALNPNNSSTDEPIGSADKQKKNTDIMERKKFLAETGDNNSDCDDEDFEDETLMERLVGLTEMFPESVRRTFSSTFTMTFSGMKSAYSLSRNVSWFLASTATLCFLPLFLELERVQTEEQEAVHQRTMMLGPRAAGGGSGLAGFSSAVPHLTPMDSK